MKDLFADIAATSWRDWLETIAEFAGMLVIIGSIMIILIGLASA